MLIFLKFARRSDLSRSPMWAKRTERTLSCANCWAATCRTRNPSAPERGAGRGSLQACPTKTWAVKRPGARVVTITTQTALESPTAMTNYSRASWNPCLRGRLIRANGSAVIVTQPPPIDQHVSGPSFKLKPRHFVNIPFTVTASRHNTRTWSCVNSSNWWRHRWNHALKSWS